MKKVTLFIVLVLILSTVLTAMIPTKMVRLTMINKSDPGTGPGDFAVYMKLQGSDVTNAFYYLTVPAGGRDTPTIKLFTVMSDVYTRDTWQCNNLHSSGTLVVASNLRLTFTQCGEVKLYCRYYVDFNNDGLIDVTGRLVNQKGQFLGHGEFLWKDICGRFVPEASFWGGAIAWGGPLRHQAISKAREYWPWVIEDPNVVWRTWRVAGEPTMEKVTYFPILRWTNGVFPQDLVNNWQRFYLFGGAWSTACAIFFWRSYTWRTPVGCNWYYQY